MEHRVLRSLDPEHQEAVLASAHRRRYARGEVVFHEGDRGDTLHLLVMGRVAVQTTTRMGEVVTVNVLGPGASFGELALVDPASRRVATIVALEPVETLRLTRSAFDELRRTEPSVNQLLVEVLAEQVTALNERLREAYFDPVEPRVCRCLARLAENLRVRRWLRHRPAEAGDDRIDGRRDPTEREPGAARAGGGVGAVPQPREARAARHRGARSSGPLTTS